MKNTFYFSHDHNARTDRKIIRMMSKMQWEGYGLYWGIVERLYDNDGEIDKDYDSMAYDLRSKPETLKELVEDYDLFYIMEDKIRSYSVDYRIALRDQKSAKARESVMKRYGNPTVVVQKNNEGTTNKIKENKIKENKIKKITARATATAREREEFEAFWLAYPKKRGKGKAFQSWEKQKPCLATCLKTIEWQSKLHEWTKEDGQFIPMPVTWLNQERWHDEPIKETFKGPSGALVVKNKYAHRFKRAVKTNG